MVENRPDLGRLLARYRDQADEAAIEALVRRTRPKLLAVACRIGAPQDAEDTVQTAYLSLLGRPDRSPDAVLPWLVTAVVRVAYRRKATEARHATIARKLSLVRSEPGPSDRASEAERGGILRRDLVRLPPRYRDPIVLHHLEGLSTPEVAQLLGVPEGTVRTWLFRGRRLLRSRLSPSLACALFLPIWAAKDAAAAVPFLAGGLAMKKATALAAVLIFLLGWGTGYVLRPDPEPATPARESQLVAGDGGREHGEAPESASVEARADTESRVGKLQARIAELEGSLAEARPVRLAEGTLDPGLAGIRVIVIDEAGRPLPGLDVNVNRNVSPFRYEQGKTDPSGRVELVDLPPGPVALVVIAPGACREGWVNLTAGRITEVRVPFPCTGVPVHGTVRDPESRPVPGVVVGLFRWEGEFRATRSVRVDESGRYRFENVAPGAYRLSVRIGDIREGRAPVEQIVVPSERALEKDIVVGIRSLFGTVRDAETGRQISEYSVSVVQPNHMLRREPTASGEYEFLDLTPGTYGVRARAPGYVQKRRGEVEILAGRELRIDFELEPAAVLILTVLDREDRPVIGEIGVSIRTGGALFRSDRLPAGEGGLLKIDEIPPGKVEIAIGATGSGQGNATPILAVGENRLTIRLR